MNRLIVLLGVFTFFVSAMGQTRPDAWAMFARTKFDPKYYEKIQEYLVFPTFPADLKALEGKEITIEGYYVPYAPEDGKYIIISKFPNSQCFFCGGAGPESIAEVNFAKPQSKFQIDDLITVKGKLKLNTDDLDHVNFILQDASLMAK